jgi:hypothetical protein
MFVLLPAVLAATLAAAVPPGSPTATALREPAALGLAVNLPDSAPAAERQKALEQVRAAGVSMFALEVSWPAAEPRPRRYDVEAVIRTARAMRQSGAVLHLDLPLVNGRVRQVPGDLASVAFDDPRLSVRLGRLLDALGPALADFSTLSLGNEADSYFADKPQELRAFLSLFRGALEFLRKKAPRLLVGVATAAPMDSRFPLIVAAVHQKSPVHFYVYAPFLPDAPFTHRPPAVIDRDWAAILSGAAGRPVAFTEVSFSSARENGSSPAAQADFVRRMRKILDRTERSRLLFARYVPWRDPAPAHAGDPPDPTAPRRAAFFANRGLQKADGKPKPAWNEFHRPRAAGSRREPAALN